MLYCALALSNRGDVERQLLIACKAYDYNFHILVQALDLFISSLADQ